MRFAAFLFVPAMVLTPAGAQIQIPAAAPSPVAAKPATEIVENPLVTLQALTAVEKDLNGRLAAVGDEDHKCVVLGRGTRGIYVTGVGTVFAVDLDLINTPAIGPFRTTISPEERASVHKRKIARLAVLESSMREMLASLAQSPYLRGLPGTEQIILGVRVMCAPWEDTSGLPGQIVIRADRQGRNIRTELQ